MAYPIGIDLGTSNSVGCVWRRGQPQCIAIEGRPILPSALSVRSDGVVLIGNSAKRRALIEPGMSITSAKRFMGDGRTTWTILKKTYTPVDVGALVLGRIKQAASEFLGHPVTEAVITVPAYFNNNQKRDTKLAGEAAGLRVLQLLPEPTAAAISYGLDKGKDQTLMVYDLGGGTFDVSILTVKGNDFTVVAVGGDSHLGGDDFDLLLARHLVSLFKKKPSSSVLEALDCLMGHAPGDTEIKISPQVRLACQQLKETAEKAKIELAESDSTHVVLPEILGTQLDAEITIETYNKLIEKLVAKTIDEVKKTLASAKLNARSIDRVILVGGSTRNRMVKDRVSAAVKDPWISEWVDEAVARGAAIVAASLAAPDVDNRPIEITFQNVTPFNLGVRASKGRDLDLFEVLIPRNTQVGEQSQAQREFTTRKTNQKSVEIAVFQGDGAHCKENTFVGKFSLTGIPPAPAGEPKIGVQFKMDQSDLLTVTATCSHLRSAQTLDVNVISREDDSPDVPPQADIMFLIDTSGSMSIELDGVKKSGQQFAEHVVASGVDCRLGLVDFDLPLSDNGYKWEVFGPMVPSKFSQAISGLRIGRLGGCGCYIGRENTIPVVKAFIQSFPDDGRLRIGILVSDEYGSEQPAIESIVQLLKNSGICLHVFGCSGSCHERLARETGGRFWDIQKSRGHIDFSELLDGVAAEITNLALK